MKVVLILTLLAVSLFGLAIADDPQMSCQPVACVALDLTIDNTIVVAFTWTGLQAGHDTEKSVLCQFFTSQGLVDEEEVGEWPGGTHEFECDGDWSWAEVTGTAACNDPCRVQDQDIKFVFSAIDHTVDPDEAMPYYLPK